MDGGWEGREGIGRGGMVDGRGGEGFGRVLGGGWMVEVEGVCGGGKTVGDWTRGSRDETSFTQTLAGGKRLEFRCCG